MQKWYILHVLSGHERKVKKWIDDNKASKGFSELIAEVLIPSEKVSEVKQGQHKITDKKIWPGYILVKLELTDDTWAFIKYASGVIDFLGGEKPSALSEAEVTEILQELDEKKGVVHKHKFEIGDQVKITEGVFVNFVGTITEVFHDKGRISVLVSIFGRDTRVDDLEFWQVEHIAQDKDG